jgi:putative tricarboxylic transport membrane protein
MILSFQVISHLFFLALGAAYALGAALLPPAAFGDPNAPKVYPLIISGLLIVLNLVLLAVELGKQKTGKGEGKYVFKLEHEGKMIVFITVACVVYSFLFERIGYVVSTFLFVEAIMLYISKGKKMLYPTLLALGFAVGIYYLFNHVFGITLPPMPFLDI